jgi:DNA invertase Pin-like site-specific DNA recombinase
MLTVLGGLAEFARDLIPARTREGRARAVANGIRLGRKLTLLRDGGKANPVHWASEKLDS